MASQSGINNTIPNANFTVPNGNIYVGSNSPSNPARISIEETVAGSTGMSIQNPSGSTSSASVVQHIVEAGAGDAYSNYVINGGQNWSAGLDNSDSDAYKITTGSSPSAGTVVIKSDTSGNITTANSVTVTTGDVSILAGNLLLPATSSTVGQVQINSVRALHTYGTQNTFVGTSGNFTLTTGSATANTGAGFGSLNALTTGNLNTCIGNNAGNKLTTGNTNVGIGHISLWNTTGSTNNVAVGYRTLQDAGIGSFNTAIGDSALGGQPLSYNIALGQGAGFGYGSSTESSNIVIGNSGTNGESNVIRLGTTGTGNGQQNLCYIAGAVTFGDSTATETHALATGAGVKTVTLGSTNTTSTTTIQSGTGGVGVTTAANANITLSPGGTGVVSVTAAPIVPTTDRADSLGSTTNSWDNVYCDGLTFDDGTNVLDTYVAPTAWVPTLTFGGGNTGMTGAFSGFYWRIANVVYVYCNIVLTAKGTSTGTMSIQTLPYTSSITGAMSIIFSSLTFTGQVIARTEATTQILRVQASASGGSATSLTDAAFANNTAIRINGFYFV